MEDSLEYVLSDAEVSATEVKRIADEVWDDLKRPGSAAAQQAKAAGIDIDALPTQRSEALAIRAIEQPFDTTLIEIVVQAVATRVTAGVLLDVWRHIVLPSILKRFGDNAIRPKKTDPKS